MENQRHVEAEKYFRRSLREDPEDAATYVDLGVLYTARKDYKRAAQYFEDSMRRDADDLNAWSNLAETYFKMKLIDTAEKEYQRILKATPDHVESHIGLGQVYTQMGDGEQDEDLYERAVSHFTRAIQMGEPTDGGGAPRASKVLKSKELAAVYYSRGYAEVRRYEISSMRAGLHLLREAQKDFKRCCDLDEDHHRARRALEKLRPKLRFFSPHWLTDKFGPWLVLSLSILVFGFAQFAFLMRKPVQITPSSYVPLTMGSLIFMVVALYLPQILKLKVAGIELEKSPVDQIATSDSLGISKPEAGLNRPT